MNCKDCHMFDSEHFDLYGEPICTEGDFTIRLKRGQGRPDNCPFRLDENTLEKAGINEIPFDLVPFLEGR